MAAAAKKRQASTNIRVGVGGWTFAPWRDNFYPKGLAQSKELGYASRQLSAIEINGTYYSTQKPESFAKWRDETPDGFVFSLKATRYATNRRVLAEAGDSVHRFIHSGIAELGPKLGPVVWQFMPTKLFEPEDFEAFLKLLPAKLGGLPLRHVLDVRHESFMVPEYLALARRYGCASVFTDSDKFPSFADPSADFVYARLMRADEKLKAGYPPKQLAQWAAHAQSWAEGATPEGLPLIEAEPPAKFAKAAQRDVFMYFINGAKERAPAAAQAVLKELGFNPREDGPQPKK